MLSPILHNRGARIFDGVAQRAGRVANNCVSVPVEHCYFVAATNYALSALVVENDDVICLLLLIVYYCLRAALAKSLDDFGGLWSCTSGHRARVSSVNRASISL